MEPGTLAETRPEVDQSTNPREARTPNRAARELGQSRALAEVPIAVSAFI